MTEGELRERMQGRLREELIRIGAPEDWPLRPYLPVKKLDSRGPGGFPMLGIVKEREPHIVYVGVKLYSEPIEEQTPAEIKHFPSWEEMILNGWVCD